MYVAVREDINMYIYIYTHAQSTPTWTHARQVRVRFLPCWAWCAQAPFGVQLYYSLTVAWLRDVAFWFIYHRKLQSYPRDTKVGFAAPSWTNIRTSAQGPDYKGLINWDRVLVHISAIIRTMLSGYYWVPARPTLLQPFGSLPMFARRGGLRHTEAAAPCLQVPFEVFRNCRVLGLRSV